MGLPLTNGEDLMDLGSLICGHGVTGEDPPKWNEPMLDLETLRSRCGSGEVFEYFFFWGLTRSKDGRITKSCFSQ